MCLQDVFGWRKESGWGWGGSKELHELVDRAESNMSKSDQVKHDQVKIRSNMCLGGERSQTCQNQIRSNMCLGGERSQTCQNQIRSNMIRSKSGQTCVWVEKGELMGMGGGGGGGEVKDCMSWWTGQSKFSSVVICLECITREYCQLIWLLITLLPMTNAAFWYRVL